MKFCQENLKNTLPNSENITKNVKKTLQNLGCRKKIFYENSQNFRLYFVRKLANFSEAFNTQVTVHLYNIHKIKSETLKLEPSNKLYLL